MASTGCRVEPGCVSCRLPKTSGLTQEPKALPALPRLFPPPNPNRPPREPKAKPRPFAGERGFFPGQRRPLWASLGTSVVFHALLVVLAILISRRAAQDADQPKPAKRADETRQRSIPIYVPPPPPKRSPPPAPPPPQPPPEQQPPKAVVPPPEKRQPEPEPEPNAPPEAKRSTGTEPPEAKRGPGADKSPTPAPKPVGPKPADVASTPTLESEARRIFGRKLEGPPTGAGPRDVRPMERQLPDRPDKCVPKPSAPRDSGAAPDFGVAVGRIFRADNGQPLTGAHLLMLGTPYTAFTDETGEYHFRFDMALVDNCRTQYVRVSAPGYESRLLVLMVGPHVRSDDVALRRRR
jgi:hypothetical protein